VATSPYRSRFRHWDTQAWVRSKSRRSGAFDPRLSYFSAGLSPLLQHPVLSGQPRQVRERLLVHQLYLYLEFTVRLETGPVNDACLLLREPAFWPRLPDGMRDDALRIYTDEAGHAEMSHTLMMAVRADTRVVPLPHEPQFLRELSAIYDADPELDRSLLTLFFVIVSETLITVSLSRLSQDARVQRQVRGLAADHAADEGRHHAYFRQVFECVWPQLPDAARRRIGVLLPRMMLAYLAPDEAALTAVLADCRIGQPAEVAREIAALPQTAAGIRQAALPSLRMFARGGVFDDPRIADAFAAHDLPAASSA
jgi:P-aminobenzoate N-oxygenase AurF